MPISLFLTLVGKSFFIAILLVQKQIHKLDMVKVLLLYTSAIWFGQIHILSKFLEAKATMHLSDGKKIKGKRAGALGPEPLRSAPRSETGRPRSAPQRARARVKPVKRATLVREREGAGYASMTHG